MKRLLAILAVIVLLCVLLVACDSQDKLPEPDAEEILQRLLEDFKSESCHSLTGKIFKNNELVTEIEARTDYVNKKIILNSNGKEYLYYGTVLVENDALCTVKRVNTDYAETLKNYLPFVINSYTYSANNRGEIYKSGDSVIVTFLNKGVKNSFGVDDDVNAGVLTVSYKNGKITSTTLSTTLTEKRVSYPLYVHYEYQSAENAFDDLPWVAPTDDISYAVFATKKLVEKYRGKTLKTFSTKNDTGVALSAFNVSEKTVKEVKTIPPADGYITLIITFETKQIVPGLSSSIQTLELMYNENYVINFICINNGINYILQ